MNWPWNLYKNATSKTTIIKMLCCLRNELKLFLFYVFFSLEQAKSRLKWISNEMKLLPLFPTKSETAERCQFHQHFMSSLFRMKAFCASFLYLKFVFVFFLAKGNGKEAACKMLVELTKGRQKIKIDWKFGRHKKQRKFFVFETVFV